MWSDIQPKHQEAEDLNKKEGEQIGGSEIYFKLIKNEKELLINRNGWTDRNTTKYIFLTLNMLSITIKQSKEKSVSKLTKNV